MHPVCLCKSCANTMPKRKRSRGCGGGVDIPEAARPSKRYCSFNSAWKDEDFKIDVGGQHNKTFLGSVLSGADGDNTAYCTLCKVQFSVCHGGANDVRKHFGTAKHVSAATVSKPGSSLHSFGFGNSAASYQTTSRRTEP